MGGKSMPAPATVRDGKKKAMDSALDWLRSNEPSLDDVDDPTLESLSNLTGMSLPKTKSDKDKQKFAEDALDWLRNNEPNLDKDFDDPTLEDIVKLAGVAMPPGTATRDERKKALEDAVKWFRNNDPDLSGVDDPTTEAFSRLTGLPMSKKMNPK